MQVQTLDPTTLFLFDSYPREVSDKRQKIFNTHQLIQYIQNNNGLDEHTFTSVYSLEFIIDKIFIDIDGNLDYAKSLCRYLLTENIQHIPIASGKKGYHIYIPLKPQLYTNTKQKLYTVTTHILEQTYSKLILQNLLHQDIIDPHLIGNIRGMCRIPNTLRPPHNLTYCTYLPQNFFHYTEQDIQKHIKQPHFYNYNINTETLPTLDTLIQKYNINIETYVTKNGNHNGNGTKLQTSISTITDIKQYLKNILRPCLYTYIIRQNPTHNARVVTTIDLLQFFNQHQISEIYSKLNWLDYDEQTTLHQIEYCSRYQPYGCKRLRQLGIPKVCCEY